MRGRRDSDRFTFLRDIADYLVASTTNKRHTSGGPASVAMSHNEAHCHIIDGWSGGSYALATPSDTVDGDCGQIILRGHATQTVTWSNYNFAAETPTFSTDPTKMIVITWKNVNGSFVSTFTGERNWTY